MGLFNLGRPCKSGTRIRNINSRRMNAKVLTKPFKRHRKEFWKKMKAWKTNGELLWTKIEEKASTSNVSKEKPFFSSNAKKNGGFLGVKSYGAGLIDAVKVDALPRNPDFALAVLGIRGATGDDTIKEKIQEMKAIFDETKDWKKNLKKRKHVVQEIVDWHRHHAIHSTYKEGSRKWIDRYIECENNLYDIKDLTSMDRIEAACTVYAGEHMEDLEEDIQENEEEGEGSESSDGSDSDAEEVA